MDNFTLGRVLWRSFFLQSAWNHKGQQNLGLASALLPALGKIYGPATPAFYQATDRSLKPFNTQPYMGGPLLGSLIKTEELGAQGGFPPERIERFRNSISTGFAAVGDAFFWNALLPATAIIALFWVVQFRMSGVVVFLVLYNIGHLGVRILGFWMGYWRGLGIVAAMNNLALPLQALRLRLFSAGALGILTAWMLIQGAPAHWERVGVVLLGLAIGPAILVLARLLRRHLPVEVFVYGLLIVLLGWTHILG